jgi:hypothetical protein
MGEGFLNLLRRHKKELEDALDGAPHEPQKPQPEKKEEPVSPEELDRRMAEYKKKYPPAEEKKEEKKGFEKAVK